MGSVVAATALQAQAGPGLTSESWSESAPVAECSTVTFDRNDSKMRPVRTFARGGVPGRVSLWRCAGPGPSVVAEYERPG